MGDEGSEHLNPIIFRQFNPIKQNINFSTKILRNYTSYHTILFDLNNYGEDLFFKRYLNICIFEWERNIHVHGCRYRSLQFHGATVKISKNVFPSEMLIAVTFELLLTGPISYPMLMCYRNYVWLNKVPCRLSSSLSIAFQLQRVITVLPLGGYTLHYVICIDYMLLVDIFHPNKYALYQ